MISVGNSDGRKGLGLGLAMEETEVEEGEALSCHGEDGDSTIDPDIALSYIEEKLQNVLGHFQKDFEGGVSAENLGAKFGGYGSFLPTYQRSPSNSHPRSPPELRNCDSPKSPRKLHLEDRKKNSLASSDPSPSLRPCAATERASSMGNSLEGNVYLQSRRAEESSSKCGVVTKSVNPSDERTLKLRIKVGSENLSTPKNAEIYSGLGLVISPSSSLEDSPPTSEGLHGKVLDVAEQSPTSILEIMTSSSESQLLSPLSEDLINLSEHRKLGVKSESEPMDNTGIESSGILVNGCHSRRSNQKVLVQKKLKSSEKNNAFSIELTNQKNLVEQKNTGPFLKSDKETDIEDLGCEELVTNALKLPLLSSSQYTIADPAKSEFDSTTVPVNASVADGVKGGTSRITERESLDGEYTQDIEKVKKLGGWTGSSSKVSESKKGNHVSSIAAYSQQDVTKKAFDHAESNVPKGRKALSAELINPLKQLVFQREGSGSEECLSPSLENSSTVGKKKSKGVHKIGAQCACMPKDQLITDSSVTSKRGNIALTNGLLSENNSHVLQGGHEKPGNRYKDSFGDREFKEDDNESFSGEKNTSVGLKDSQLVGKRRLSETNSASKHKCNIKKTEKPRIPEKYPRVDSQVVPPPGNGPSSEDPTGIVPLVDEFWVFCENCKKWRLLPLDIDPKSLPDKWLCRMLTWLPGMNHCRIPVEVTNNAVKALYHPVASVPAPVSESQHTWLSNSAPTSAGVASVDSKVPGQVHQNIAFQTATISGKRKHGSTDAKDTTDIDGSTHSSNSRRKNLPTSGKDGNLNQGNPSPFLDASGYQHMRQPNGDIEKHNDNRKGTSLKIKSKRESDLDSSRASKKIKGDEFCDDENWTSDIGEAFLKTGCASTSSLSNNASGNDQHKYISHEDARGNAKNHTVSVLNSEMHVPHTSEDGLRCSGKSDINKRKEREYHGSQFHTEPLSSSERRHPGSGESMKEMYENDHWKGKKAKVYESGGKDSSGSKTTAGTDRKGMSTKEQHNERYLNNTQTADYLKSNMGSVQHSVAANTSSSNISGSHKKKTRAQEVKGSPHDSGSSSPLGFSNSNAFKVTSTSRNLVGKENFDDYALTAVSPSRSSGNKDDGGNDRTGVVKKDSVLAAGGNDHLHQRNQCASEKHSSDQCQVEVKTNSDQSQKIGSHSKKSAKGLSPHSANKDSTLGSDLDKVKTKASVFLHDSEDHMHLYKEKSKSKSSKLDEEFGTPREAHKFIVKKDTAGGTLSEKIKGESRKESGVHDVLEVIESQDKKKTLQQEFVDTNLHMKNDQGEVCGSGKSHSRPPMARVPTGNVAVLQPDSASKKQNGVEVLAVDALDSGNSQKTPNQSKKAENQNGQPVGLRHPTRNPHKVQDVEAASPLRRDSSNYTANNALKEAKDLKHLADRFMNSGSTESTGYYFQAVIKFLHGAYLLESGNSEGTKKNDTMHAMHIYSTTAKLCEFCARNYEKSKDMAAAALAYKCMEVAYMRVVFSSHISASRDRNELLTAFEIIPPGESPSSSASDVENLNQPATTDKIALAKVVSSPQVSGSQNITSQNRSTCLRLLKFTEDVNFAMEASRKSRIAFATTTSVVRETLHKEGISSLKKALDFNFQDVESFLRLVRVAMEAIAH